MTTYKTFQVGGRYVVGQEVYYAIHRMRLWEWYCISSGVCVQFKDMTKVYKKSVKTLQAVCASLDLPTTGTKEQLIARLDWYDFTAKQMKVFSQN